MNDIKNRMIWFAVTAAVGALFTILGFLNPEFNMLCTLGISLVAVSLVKILQYNRIKNDAERLRKYELYQKEERVIFIANKTRSLMFILSIYVEFVAVLIAVFMQQTAVAMAISWVICAQVVIYMAVYWYYNKKY